MRIFLSYHTPDSRIAEALKLAIEAKLEGSEVFVAHRDLRYGAPWQPQLSESIAAADAFIILLGSKVGRWQLPEYYAAHNRSVMQPEFALVPVLTADDAPALPFLSSIHYLKAADPAREPHLSEIVAALKGETARTDRQQLWLSVNPYRGLESLREEDADFFFGREQETAAALNLLASPVNGIVTLIGNSGVGKSSLVEAGVFAALRRQVMPTGAPWPSALNNSREWATITMRPGDDPIQALVAAFMDLWFGDMTDPDRISRRNRWAKLFHDGEGQLRDIIQATFDRFEKELALPAPRRILLNINQAEELYSLAPEATREPFSKLIAQALTDRRFAVIASIRSDYYGYHQANVPLFDHMHRLDVRPFDADGLKRVITGPAEVLGASFESGELADFIVRGAAGQAGALPLLAFYMTDLWERMQKRGDGVLRLIDKTEMVDVSKALTAQADRFLAEHPADIDAVKRLFTLKLARVHEEGKAVRRRVARAKLDETEWKLVEALSEPRWRLVTTGDEGEGDEGAYAEVAHEVLLQSWSTLVAWLEAERGFLAFKARVEQAQAVWLINSGRDKRALLAGLDLIQAEQWLATRERDFDADDAAFIRESVAARDVELAAAARFRRRVQWGTALTALLMAAIALLAGFQWMRAEHQKKRAEQESARAEKALRAAAKVANGLVFDLAQELRDTTGVQARTIGQILKHARQLTNELGNSGLLTPELERNRSAALNESVDHLLRAGNIQDAEEAARESVTIMERLMAKLAQSDQARTDWQRDLAISLERIGDMHASGGEKEAAIAAFKRALSIYQRLSAKHPDDIQSRIQSVVPHLGLAELEDGQRVRHLEATLAILQPLAAEGRLDAQRMKWIPEIEATLRQAKAILALEPLLVSIPLS